MCGLFLAGLLFENSFSLSNLSCNVDNGNGGSLVAAVHNLDLLKKELSNKNSAKKIINSLTAIGGPDRQLFFELRARGISANFCPFAEFDSALNA